MKGWTVVTQATKDGSKGIAKREYYLHDKTHPNHSKTNEIKPIWGTPQRMQQIAYNGESYTAKQSANRKGGRPPSSFAVEFTLNLPKGYRPTTEQWQKIVKQVIIDISKKLGIKPQELSDQTYGVLHQQDQTPNLDKHGREQGTGDHLHLVIGKFTLRGTYLRDLQRKTITNTVKNAFNYASRAVCGFDWTEYRDHKLKAQEYANKRNIPSWKIKAARELKNIEEQQTALNEKAKILAEKGKEIDQQMEEAVLTKRLMATFEKRAEKWFVAEKENNLTDMNRQANRLNKSLLALDAFGLLSSDPVTLEAAGIVSRVETLLDEINAKKPNTLLIKPNF